ncbi:MULTISPECIES: SGNH/GDSL hydrolase family protein [unclassified Arthrobacter]|uniref:SGNH/GDSL hydrolase family protein n=1 Tax=unclassified Arthrobacter TaxID=235627 RepID=UPI00356323D8
MHRTQLQRLRTLLYSTAAALALVATGVGPATAALTPTAGVPATHATASHGSSFHGTAGKRHHHPPQRIDYVNLGDSYSAGFGSGNIVAGPFPGCLQGDGPTHVTRLAARPGVRLIANAACAGATPSDVATVAAGLKPQLAAAELVTLTLGGNDLDFRGIATACSTQGTAQACALATTTARRAMPGITSDVRSTLRKIDRSTRARILVLGYPRLFSPQFGDNAVITAGNARALNRLADQLNRAVRAGTRGHASFVPVTSAFTWHGIGSPVSWIHLNPLNPADPVNLHPTTAGYLYGYYPAVLRKAQLHRLAR